MCWEIIKLLFIWKQKISHSHIAVLQSHISGLPRCKNLWIFSLFRALFVCVLYIVSGLFVVLLVPCFTSLVSFTGFYTEDEPIFQFCCLSFLNVFGHAAAIAFTTASSTYSLSLFSSSSSCYSKINISLINYCVNCCVLRSILWTVTQVGKYHFFLPMRTTAKKSWKGWVYFFC